MPISRIAIGAREDVSHPSAVQAALAEFIATLIFVFAAHGSRLAFCRATGGDATTPASLLLISTSNAFALSASVSAAANISGGHLNPAVTFGLFVGGNITFLRGLLYCFAQLLASTFACLLLRLTTGTVSSASLSLTGVFVWNGLLLEIILTFGLVYAMYAAAVDPKKGSLGVLWPFVVGFLVGANMLAGGMVDGATMNPAAAFGPAVVEWAWEDHWVHWAGPLIGGGLAGLVYEFFFISHSPEQLPTREY